MSETTIERTAEPTRAEVVHAATDAFAADGYAENGTRDLNALRDAIFDCVSRAVVASTRERETKAVTRSRLLEVVMPSLPKSGEWSEQEDPMLAEAAYNEVRKVIWDQCGPTGPVQYRVGQLNEGLVLCRTHITDDRLSAAYVTADRKCISADLTGPFNRKAHRLADNYKDVIVLLVERQPENGRKFRSEYTSGIKNALTTGTGEIDLAIAAAEDNSDDEPEGASAA